MPENDNQSNNDQGGLKGALDKLKAGIGDLTSLEVQTYVGSIALPKMKDKDNNDVDVTNFEDFLKLQIAVPNGLTLVAVTKMNFDGDAINLVPAEGFPEHVLKVHEAAVKAGIETRHGILTLFGGMLGLTSNK
ncbi:MAG: hypothetical protein JKY87_01605 [Mariprofundus sp.]|nr:hypothetical protein [Mariprofundus sp.]